MHGETAPGQALTLRGIGRDYDVSMTPAREAVNRLVAEGGSAVGVAALLSGKLGRMKGPVAAIITGRNLNMAVHAAIMAGEDVTLGETTIRGRRYGE